MSDTATPTGTPVLNNGTEPCTRRQWIRDVWAHRGLTRVLARKDFQTRYKRASFGILWAVALPLMQAIVLAAVFSRFNLVTTTTVDYRGFVLAGVLPYSYFTSTLGSGATAVVDGSGLADKIWFPRAVLPLVPTFANAVGLAISIGIIVIAMPILGISYSWRLLLLGPAALLMILFTAGVCLVLSALHVYFRDVRFIVQGVLTILFFVTPIVYPTSRIGDLGKVIEFNPLTGILTLFRFATVGNSGPLLIPLTISVLATITLGIAAMEAHRVHDRLFVDLL